jgi:hypothetical protein
VKRLILVIVLPPRGQKFPQTPKESVWQETGKGPHSNGDHEPNGIEEQWEGPLGAHSNRVWFVDQIGGKGFARSFVTLGTDDSISSNGVHQGIVMPNTGYGLLAVTLAAGDTCPYSMQATGLLGMAFDASPAVV